VGVRWRTYVAWVVGCRRAKAVDHLRSFLTDCCATGSGDVSMNLVRVGILSVQVFVLAGCGMSQFISKLENGGTFESPDAAATVRNADLTARNPTTVDERSGGSDQALKPLLFPGTPADVAPASPDPGTGIRTASAQPISFSGDGVEMNFESADIQTVAKTLLGDVLQLNFVVDPRVQGTVTLASVGPIQRKDVLPAFESALRMQNAAVVHDGKFLKIVPMSEAAEHSTISTGAGEPGFGVSVVPLRYVSASTVAHTAESLIGKSGGLHVDKARNLVFVQGTTSEREAAIDVISTFDVEWLRNQSVGVYPLKSTSPETMITELEKVFETQEGGAGRDIVRFQPISRMNAVMVVTKNPTYLQQTSAWVERLDRSDNNGTTVRTYRLKYGNASQIAKVLSEVFGTQRTGSGSDSPINQISPGSTAATSRLDSLDKGGTLQNSNGSSSTPLGGTGTGTTTGTGSAATTIAAAFESFSDGKDDKNGDASHINTPTSSGGSGPKGVFQNVRITADTVNNAVVVYSNQEDYRVIEAALRDFDRPRLQVAIDATVAEVTLTNELTWGVQYYLNSNQGSLGLFNATTAAAAVVPATSAAATAASAAVPALQQTLPGFNAVLGNAGLPRVILSALSSVTDVKVLSSPSIVVMDNQPALLQVGDEVPITTSSANVLTTQNTIVNTIQMQNTGVILKVLPHVNANGTVQLEVDQEVSQVVNPQQQTLTPTISERRIHSTVAVTSGQTVLLGGLISDNDQKTTSGIPGLSDIKVLGGLFGNTDHTKQRTEIIIFIRPQLIGNSVDARAVTEEFREKLQSMKRAPTVISGSNALSSIKQ
jgi:general secretion pathway protein D